MPPFRLRHLAADELPHLPIQLDQRRIHRLHRTLPRCVDQLRDLIEIVLWDERCRHVDLRRPNCLSLFQPFYLSHLT